MGCFEVCCQHRASSCRMRQGASREARYSLAEAEACGGGTPLSAATSAPCAARNRAGCG